LHFSPQIAYMYLHWEWSYSIYLLAMFVSDTLYFTLWLLSKLSLLLFSWSRKNIYSSPTRSS
jgi:hypothetical protein